MHHIAITEESTYESLRIRTVLEQTRLSVHSDIDLLTHMMILISAIGIFVVILIIAWLAGLVDDVNKDKVVIYGYDAYHV